MSDSWSLELEAIGTPWQIDIYEPVDTPRALEAAIRERIEAFDEAYSRFRPDSLITAMANAAGVYKLPSDADILLGWYRQLYDATNGAVTPLAGQLLVEAGYDAGYSLTPSNLHELPGWDDVLSWEEPILTLSQPAWLDFGAAGKGYLVDIVSEIIEAAGFKAYCVDASGDMRYRSLKDSLLSVGLEHPDDPTQAIGVARLGNQSLCGSAGNRRAWGNFHHIIDPRTLASPKHIKAAWVVAGSTLEADGLTIAIYFTDPERLRRQFEFDYAIITDDNIIHASSGFPAEFFN